MAEAAPYSYHAFSKAEFEPGVIIRAPIHEEDFRRTPRPLYPSFPNSPTFSNNTSHKSSSHISHTDFGAVYSENRLFIIVQQFATHYLAVPLFTYQGTGLRPPEHDPSEYASIEDHRYPGTSARQAPHLLITGELKPWVKRLRGESVAHLTYPVSRKYNLHVAYQGRLRDEDAEVLVRLFREKTGF